MGFGPCWVGGRSIAYLEVGPQWGFARETLGEPSTFELWQTGHIKVISGTSSIIEIFKDLITGRLNTFYFSTNSSKKIQNSTQFKYI